MKVKFRDIYEAQPGLMAIMQCKQPPGTTFHFVDLAQAIEPKMENFEKQRMAWIEELGDKQPGDQTKSVQQMLTDGSPNPKFVEFERLFNEMMDKDIDLPGVEPFPRESFGGSDLQPGWIMSLGVFVSRPKVKSPAPQPDPQPA